MTDPLSQFSEEEIKLLSSITPDDLKTAENIIAKSSFLDFINKFTTEPPPAPHHEFMIKYLQKVADGKIRRLMICMPPRHAKSFYASIMFPAYWLGVNPSGSILCCSHNTELAELFSKRVRRIVGLKEYKEVYGVGLDPKSQAAGYWNTSSFGEYKALGVGSGPHGRSGELVIIDDPIPDSQSAKSELFRKNLWDWYITDITTRLEPDAAVIVINTRWHEEDLSGHLLELSEKGLEDWTVINLPALAEEDDQFERQPGEALWPSRWSVDRLIKEKRNIMTPRDWASLYQQRPAPEEGAHFQKEWIKYYDVLPKNLTYYAASDYAVSLDDGDYTVHGIFGIDQNGDRYIVDWWRSQATTNIWVDKMAWFIKKYNIIQWGEEAGVILKAVDPYIRIIFRKLKIHVYRKQYPSSTNKEVRAASIVGWMANYGMYLPRNESWTPALVQEILTFPNGKYDDQVDVLSLFGRMLNKQRQPQKNMRRKKIKIKTLNQMTYDEAFPLNKKKGVSLINNRAGY